MAEIDPQETQEKTPIKNSRGKPKKLRVGVYFASIAELQAVADAAVKAGFRRGGLPVIRKKPHGWGDEVLVNADGIARYLKKCHAERAATEKIAEGLKALGVKK